MDKISSCARTVIIKNKFQANALNTCTAVTKIIDKNEL